MFISNILLISLSFIILFKYIWDRRRYYRISWQMNGPIGFPLIGSGLLFLNISSQWIKKPSKL